MQWLTQEQCQVIRQIGVAAASTETIVAESSRTGDENQENMQDSGFGKRMELQVD